MAKRDKRFDAYIPDSADFAGPVLKHLREVVNAALPGCEGSREALAHNRKALSTFNAFSPSQRKEYIEWIIEAKSDATPNRRLEQAADWMAEGKQRHWKYQK